MAIIQKAAGLFVIAVSLSLSVTGATADDEKAEVWVVPAIVIDFETEQVIDCADPVNQLMNAETCAQATLVLIRGEPKISPKIIGTPEPHHHETENIWTIDRDNGDGTVTRACGEWSAEDSGWDENVCGWWIDDGTLKSLHIYRCLDTATWCDSNHWTTGIVKSFLDYPADMQFYKTYQDGEELSGCGGFTGSGAADIVWATVQRDTSPSCGTTAVEGYWGGGATIYL